MALQLCTFQNPKFFHLFSSSPSSNFKGGGPQSSSLSSTSIKQSQFQPQRISLSTSKERPSFSVNYGIDGSGSQMQGIPNLMPAPAPPKKEKVDKYIQPDTMPSEVNLKLEPKTILDEFKMSESDCGSSAVQVVRLTSQIKHLSSVLHKKDNHSRRGLQAMVQRRKKLLKYLRRTNWDTYCLVLSRLGLKDNQNYKP